MSTRFCPSLLLLFAAALIPDRGSAAAANGGRAEHVVLVVWDGMRPDFVSAQFTPQLYELAQNGVFFRNHHPVYISSTEVNGTALATGVYPNRSGIVANSEYRPEIGWASPNATEGLEMIRRGDLATGGKYIRVPTMCEIVQAAGFPTAVCGVKPVAILQDRSQRKSEGAAKDSIVLYAGRIMPSWLQEAVERVNDNRKFPTNSVPNSGREDWTGKALREVVWKKGIPKLSVIWLSEPDASQHDSSPGSDNAINALDVADRRLTSILKLLEEKKAIDKTDVLIVSDHGFSTVARGFELVDFLKRSGFKATKKFEDSEPGDIMVVGLGGSAYLYVVDHKEDVIRKLVTFLQNSEIAGVIFSKLGRDGHVEGTFPLSAVRLDAGDGTPDVVVSFKWTDQKNDYDTPGFVYSEGGKRGRGTHASLSRFDMHNTLIACGPSFKRGFIDELPSANPDVAPTILSILGIRPPQPMDGRVLSEALINGKAPSGKPKTETRKASRVAGLRQWEQYLKTTTFGGAFYVEEGNGSSTLRQ